MPRIPETRRVAPMLLFASALAAASAARAAPFMIVGDEDVYKRQLLI